MRMPNCPHPYDLQSLYDGEMTPGELALAREHLAHCDECAARVGEYERLRWILQSRPIEQPQGLVERIAELLKTTLVVRKLACREARRMASEYVDDALDQAERETLEAHLFACDGCYHEYVATRTTAEALRSTPRAVASPDLQSRILAAVAQEAAQPERAPQSAVAHRPFAWRRALVPALGTLALALVAFGVFGLVHHPQPAQPTSTVAALPAGPTAEPAPVTPAPEPGPQPETTAPTTPTQEAPAVADATATPDAVPDATVPPRSERAAPMPRAGERPPTPEMPRLASMPRLAPTTTRPTPAPAAVGPPPRPARPAPRPSRPTVTITPPEIASAARATGIVRVSRTPARVYTRPSAIAPAGGYPAPPVIASVPHTPVGVTSARPLAPSGSSPAVPRPAPTSLAALTRPEPRVVAPTPSRNGGLEETSGSYLAVSPSLTPRRSGPTTRVGAGTSDPNTRLAELSRGLHARDAKDRDGSSADW